MRKPRVFFLDAARLEALVDAAIRDARDFIDRCAGVFGSSRERADEGSNDPGRWAQPARSRFTGKGPGQTVGPTWPQFKRVGLCKVNGAVGVSRNVGWLVGETGNGRPRLRKQYATNYYVAFVLDPDGNIKGVYRGA